MNSEHQYMPRFNAFGALATVNSFLPSGLGLNGTIAENASGFSFASGGTATSSTSKGGPGLSHAKNILGFPPVGIVGMGNNAAPGPGGSSLERECA
ncbi:unnamed protein product, partial [Amoebophrya sp. A25]|eukprot:GSA25T00000446001.1